MFKTEAPLSLSLREPVVIGMSGGVDSAVSAYLLKEQGIPVVGLFMKNWEEGDCTAQEDYYDVRRVCDQLQIPYYAVDFIEEYQTHVFASFLKDIERGWTPNPDVLCNREIKFGVFLKKVLQLGARELATGHYCQVRRNSEGVFLLKGKDAQKDQSYFLGAISRNVLERVQFPIGHLEKSEVRAIARKLDLKPANKKDSVGICFIGKRDMREFLQRYLKVAPGPFLTLSGKKVGNHEGVPFYTLGQRRGLSLGGEGERWFVVGKDLAQNAVYVERGEGHPALYADELIAEEINWLVSSSELSFPLECGAKIRYRQADQLCRVTEVESGSQLRVQFHVPQRAVTPGQYVVFYQGEVCLGSARIVQVGASYHAQKKEVLISTKQPVEAWNKEWPPGFLPTGIQTECPDHRVS